MIEHGDWKPEEYQRVTDSIEKPQPENLYTHTMYYDSEMLLTISM